MKTTKRIVASLVAIMMLFSLCLSANAAQYSDTEQHWAKEVIEKWSNKGVIQGYGGKFYPDANIKRGDMAVIINKIKNYDTTAMNTFSDLETDAYYAKPILALNQAGIMLGDGKTIRPEDPLTRQEAFVLLCKVYQLDAPTSVVALTFTDKNDIADWALVSVKTMFADGIVKGSEGKVNPTAYITRAEVIQLLEQITNYVSTGSANASNNSSSTALRDDDGITISNDSTPSSGSTGSGSSSGGSTTGGLTQVEDKTEEDNSSAVGSNDKDGGYVWDVSKLSN